MALWRDVKAEYPEESERTWAAIDRAVSSAMTQLVSAHGTPAASCGQDGRLEDAILMVQWNVSTRTGHVNVAGGRAVDVDLDSQTRECLERYLAFANVQFTAAGDIVELDILYEVPFPASPA